MLSVAEKAGTDMSTSKEIVHLALRSGYSFKRVYGHLDEIIEYGHETGYIGVADLASTFSHPMLEQKCKGKIHKKALFNKILEDKNIQPIYAVRLTVVGDATEKVKPRGQFGLEYIFIAKNNSGLQEMYNLVDINFNNFYYRGNISQGDVSKLSENVIVIAESFCDPERVDYIALTTTTPLPFREYKGIPKVAIINNYYPKPEDVDTYELFTAPRNNSNQTYQQHILTTKEWRRLYKKNPEREKAIRNTHLIAKMCEIEELEKAPMIKYDGPESIDLLCRVGARKKKIDLEISPYKERYEFEINLIKDLGFQDYFLVVADLVVWAKKRMLVGPSRGSSAGSLVCYLMSITEIEPIEYDLLFERFIDINRSDLPDIDIDFPDDKRDSVLKYLTNKYGDDKVKQIANVSTMKPKGAIGEFAKALDIPPYETEEVKNAIITRSGGDARAAMCILDTFETTETGKDFIKKYPSMALVSNIENHPRHTSVHAAGVIVCNDPIRRFAGTNSRDNTAMVDKKTSEYLNLLKIDVLGLRTLTILAECAASVGVKNEEFYSMPLDDEKAFDIFNSMRLSGIFQFEGHSLSTLTRKMGINLFEDITAITSLARPGALYSGGANRYIKYRLGEESPVFVGKEHEEITGATYGIVVYQEQILRICREIGEMSWDDVNSLRRALSKSMGKEFFNRYKEKFVKGALKNGYSNDNAEFIWSEVENGGAYAFNKSHAVAYAMISYWCAHMKAYYPKEFLVSNLNNAKDDDSALKILRDAVTHDGVKYIPIDSDESLKNWSVNSSGVVIGGLLNIDGIGASKANKIISSRKNGEKLPPGIIKKMINPETKFDVLFPCRHYWGDLFNNYQSYGLSASPSEIVEVQEKGEYLIIGRLMSKNVRDLNEYVNLQKRGGKVLLDNTNELSIKIEDDTDTIMASVGRFDYDRIGRQIAEEGIVEKDWYLIKGVIRHKSRYLGIKEVMKLDKSMMETE